MLSALNQFGVQVECRLSALHRFGVLSTLNQIDNATRITSLKEGFCVKMFSCTKHISVAIKVRLKQNPTNHLHYILKEF